MFVHTYLRVSTIEQDAGRVRAALDQSATHHGQSIANEYMENVSGASADRAELMRLLKDARTGDVLLVEASTGFLGCLVPTGRS